LLTCKVRKKRHYEDGIIGSGDVGQRLADGFIELGHTVKIGSRDPNQKKVIEWVDKHGKEEATRAWSRTFAETASFGELHVIATSWDGTTDAMKMADPKNFAGKFIQMLLIHQIFPNACLRG
jgi:8-hydroxy-5-deazaflavin:NADPH oxidoreductase